VYEGTYESRPAAVKVIERGSEHTVEREIAVLLRLRGMRNIVQLWAVIRADSTLLIFELVPGISRETFYADVTIPRLRHVLRCLLEALRCAHSVGIVHRDVKLANVLVSADWATVRLIDWGCACQVSGDMSPRAGSRPVRSIEMLLQDGDYGTAADMWAVGVLIWTTLCGGETPWRADSSWNTLVQIAGFVGRRPTIELARSIGTQIPDDVYEDIYRVPRRNFADCFAPAMRSVADPHLVDLMEKLLVIWKEVRLTAQEALAHPFFAE
jgi:casein kinase II subunit alpha